MRFLSGTDIVPYYSFKGSYVEEFDDEWLEQFIEKYNSVDNSGKRELALSLLGMVFDFDIYSTDANIQHTKDNFKKLSTYLGGLKTGDGITDIVNKSFIEKIRSQFGIE